ncbi:MAG: dynamin family protein [Aulosira sp. DedQUE10]|nr:dynamin family protein [Aulosira sp. DedQUE10]
MTLTKTFALVQYEQWKVKIQNLLNNLAKIAAERGEILRFDDLDSDDIHVSPQENSQPLAEILQQKSLSLNSLFRLAVVGHFCRGKSTLINAMLDRILLTGDLRPNTATSAVLRYGMPERFRVTFKPKSGKPPVEYQSNSPEDLAQALVQFTSDAAVDPQVHSDDGQKYIDLLQGKQDSLAQSIDGVELWCGSDFLKINKIEIIDTPGLGSVFKEHKRVTLNILPQVDATLFVIQPDPGIGKREIAFIQLIKEQVANIFFVLTKADQMEREEIPEMVDFIRDAIANIVELPVEHIYPVSALNALQGNQQESGFEVFLPALQQFLIKKSGISRLLNAVRLGRGYSDQMIIYVEKDIAAQSQSLQELHNERQKIQQAAHQIKEKKQKLIETINSRIAEIISQALHGLESMPTKMRQNVEQRINSLNLQQLQEADDYLQPVMKNTIVSWLQENQISFEKEMNRLSDRVKQEIKSMLGEIQSSREQELFEHNFEMQLNSPISTNNLISTSIGNDIVRMLASVGITGIVADFLGGLVDVGAQVVKSIGNFFDGLFGGKKSQQSRPSDRLQKARQKVREVLLAEVGNNGNNAYQAIVNGYQNYNGCHVNGVRNAVEESFRNWGQQLQERINALINSNVNGKLSQLDRQINDLATTTSEAELNQKIQMYRRQHEQLQALGLELYELEEEIDGRGDEGDKGEITNDKAQSLSGGFLR